MHFCQQPGTADESGDKAVESSSSNITAPSQPPVDEDPPLEVMAPAAAQVAEAPVTEAPAVPAPEAVAEVPAVELPAAAPAPPPVRAAAPPAAPSPSQVG